MAKNTIIFKIKTNSCKAVNRLKSLSCVPPRRSHRLLLQFPNQSQVRYISPAMNQKLIHHAINYVGNSGLIPADFRKKPGARQIRLAERARAHFRGDR